MTQPKIYTALSEFRDLYLSEFPPDAEIQLELSPPHHSFYLNDFLRYEQAQKQQDRGI